MKRFLMFAYSPYYPSGGWQDFHKDVDTLEEAKALADETTIPGWADGDEEYREHVINKDIVHVVDTETGEMTILRKVNL